MFATDILGIDLATWGIIFTGLGSAFGVSVAGVWKAITSIGSWLDTRINKAQDRQDEFMAKMESTQQLHGETLNAIKGAIEIKTREIQVVGNDVKDVKSDVHSIKTNIEIMKDRGTYSFPDRADRPSGVLPRMEPQPTR